MLNKLIKVERTINIYRCTDNSFVEEIDIDVVPFEILKKIVESKEDDLLLYDGYIVDVKQINQINKFVNNKIVPDFITFFYVLECSGIYDW